MTREQRWQEESDAMAQEWTVPAVAAVIQKSNEVVLNVASTQAATHLDEQRKAKEEAARLLALAQHQVQTIADGRIKATTGNRRLALMLLTASKEVQGAI
jgi:hypothetical protein